jgi:hypothetical protein
MAREIRNRIIRAATPEERDRHNAIRKEVEQDLPELTKWARQIAAEHTDRVAVGTVFTADETPVVQAIDQYASDHSLNSRSAVIREALARLLDIEISRE